MKIISSAFFFFLLFCGYAQNSKKGLTEKDLKDLVGTWSGSMIVTSSADEKTQQTISTLLEIVDLKDSLGFNFTYTEPGGKQLTEKNSLRIYDDGNMLSFDSAQFDIVEIRRRGARLSVIAEREGVDKYLSADFQETIIIGPGILNITKGIRYMDMTAYFIRKRLILTKIK